MNLKGTLIQNLNRTSIQIAEQLEDTGLCVCSQFIDSDSLSEIRNDLDFIHTTGKFQPAGIGHNTNKNINNSIRKDETYWLDQDNSNHAQSLLWDKVALLRQAFNKTLFLGLQNFEGHYATYSEDGFYKRHLDSSPKNNVRMVTMVLYLNLNWQEHDGGKLRIYSKNSHTDISPRGGTLVCFLSEESEHEVLPSHAPRYSFTGWFNRALTI